MQRTLIIVAMVVLAAIPTAIAHFPPGPVFAPCQEVRKDSSQGKYHDYWAGNGFLVFVTDGNLDDCNKPNPIKPLPIFTDEECALIFAQTGVKLPWPFCNPPPKDPVPPDVSVDQPLFDYDGELEFGIGGGFLFVNTGDGLTHGVQACFGWPAVGHHGGTIYVQDAIGGPGFTVTADYSLPGEEETPDCGDNFVDPCDSTPPDPSTLDFPLNVVVDTVNGVVYNTFGNPNGGICNPLDNAQYFPPQPIVNRGVVNFAPGADGAYVVFVEVDVNAARASAAGHIWTD